MNWPWDEILASAMTGRLPMACLRIVRGWRPITWELKMRRRVATKRKDKKKYIIVKWTGTMDTANHELLHIFPNSGSRHMLGVPELAEHSSVLHTSHTKRLAHYKVFLDVSASLSMQILSLRNRKIFISRKAENAFDVSRISQQKRR